MSNDIVCGLMEELLLHRVKLHISLQIVTSNLLKNINDVYKQTKVYRKARGITSVLSECINKQWVGMAYS